MKTNSDMTIFNRTVESRVEAFYRTIITDVEWENRKAVNVLASGGNIQSDQVVIFIPYARGDGSYVSPKAWQALASKTGFWTLAPGDIVVRGQVTDDIDEDYTVSDLKSEYDDVLSISSVDTMNLGSRSMWHWEVGAK